MVEWRQETRGLQGFFVVTALYLTRKQQALGMGSFALHLVEVNARILDALGFGLSD